MPTTEAPTAPRHFPKPPRPAKVRILPAHKEEIPSSGALGSIQSAEIVVASDYLDQIWTADNLEYLARGYWAFLRRVFLGLVRVIYSPTARTVVFLHPRIPLLKFGAPRFDAEEGTGLVTWPIEDGVLVAREGRGEGHLQVKVERSDTHDMERLGESTIKATVEVKNFYPGLRGRGRFARFGAWFYAQTQLRIHVIVCNAYLRSLPRLDFPAVDTTGMPSDQKALTD